MSMENPRTTESNDSISSIEINNSYKTLLLWNLRRRSEGNEAAMEKTIADLQKSITNLPTLATKLLTIYQEGVAGISGYDFTGASVHVGGGMANLTTTSPLKDITDLDLLFIIPKIPGYSSPNYSREIGPKISEKLFDIYNKMKALIEENKEKTPSVEDVVGFADHQKKEGKPTILIATVTYTHFTIDIT